MKFCLPKTNNIAGMIKNAVHALMEENDVRAIFAGENDGPYLVFRPKERVFEIVSDCPKVDQSDSGPGEYYIDTESVQPIVAFTFEDVLKSLVGLGFTDEALPREIDEDVLEEIGFEDEQVATVEALDDFIVTLTDLRDKCKAVLAQPKP